MATMNGTGQGGKTYEDRQLANRVRTLALSEIEKILKNRKNKLYDAVIIKLAGTVLPRLNEHSGLDGEKLIIHVESELAEKYNVKANAEPSTTDNSPGSTSV